MRSKILRQSGLVVKLHLKAGCSLKSFGSMLKVTLCPFARATRRFLANSNAQLGVLAVFVELRIARLDSLIVLSGFGCRVKSV